jgi:hypothetical protein
MLKRDFSPQFAQTLSDSTVNGSAIAGTGKVDIAKGGEAHIAKGLIATSTGNISIKPLNNSESEYLTLAVNTGLNDFGILFDRIDKSATTVTLANVTFLL